MVMINPEVKDSLAVFRTGQGVEIRATLLRLTPYGAAFEVYNPDAVIRTSEVLEDFKVFINDQPAYSGRAVVRDSGTPESGSRPTSRKLFLNGSGRRILQIHKLARGQVWDYP